MAAARYLLRRVTKRLVKTTAWLALCAVLTVAATIDLLQRPGSGEVVRRVALAQLHDLLPGLRIGAIRGDFTSRLELRDVELRDRFGGPAVALDTLILRYRLQPLLDQVVQVDRIELVGPRVVVRETRGGALNLAELVTPQPPSPAEPDSGPSSWRVMIAQLAIRGGSARIASGGGDRPLEVRRLELRAGAALSGEAIGAQLRRIAVAATLPDGRQVQATLFGTARYRLAEAELETDLTLEAKGLLPTGAATLKLHGHGPLDALGFDATLDLPRGGALALDGEIGARQPLAYRVQATMRHIDPSALLARAPRGDINLHLTASGSGIPPQAAARAKVALRVDPSKGAGYALRTLALDATLHGAGWRLSRLRLNAYGATLRASGHGDLGRGSVELEARVPHLRRLPLPGGAPPLRGSLRLHASGSGPFGGPWKAKVRLAGGDLRMRRLSLGSLRLEASAARLPKAPHGKLSLRLAELDVGKPGLAIGRATLRAAGSRKRLAVTLHARGPQIATDLDTRLALNGPHLRAEVRALSARFRRLRAKMRGRARLSYHLSDGSATVSGLRLRALGGRVALDGQLHPRRRQLSAELELRDVRVPLALLGGLRGPAKRRSRRPAKAPRLSGRLALAAGSRALKTRGRLQLENPGVSVKLDARLPLRYRPGHPLPEPAARRPLAAKIDVRASDLGQLQPLLGENVPPLGGHGRVALTASGSLHDPQLSLHVNLAKLRAGRLRDVGAQLTATADARAIATRARIALGGHPLVVLKANAATTLGALRRGLLAARDKGPLRSVPLELQLRVPSTSISRLISLAPDAPALSGRAELALTARGSLDQLHAKARIGASGLKVGPRKLGSLVADLSLAAGHRLRTSLQLTHDTEQLLQLTATVRRRLLELVHPVARSSAPLSAEIVLHDYPLERLQRYLPRLAGLAGQLRLNARASGSLGAPRVSAQLALERAGWEDARFGKLRVDLDYRTDRATAHLHARQHRGGKLEAHVEARLGRAPRLSARLKARALRPDVAARLTGALKEARGSIDIDLRAAGPLTHPHLSGSIALAEGKLRLRGLPAFDDLELKLGLQPKRLVLHRLRLRNGGTLRASGTLTLRQLHPDALRLRARADRLRVGVAPIADARFSGEVTVRGALAAHGSRPPALHLHVGKSRLEMPKLGGGESLHATGKLADVEFVDARGRRARRAVAAAPAPPLALRIDAGPLHVQSEQLEVVVRTGLRIGGDKRGRPVISGRIELPSGWVDILGRRFALRRAHLSFQGRHPPDPALDIQIHRRFPETELFVSVTGRASDPLLELRSDPGGYSKAQLLSLLVSGRIDSGRTDDDASGAAASAVANALVGGMLGSVARKVGVDVARVSVGQQTPQKGSQPVRAEAEFGKYLFERLYVGYRRVIGGSADENHNIGLLEYRISRRWLLSALFGDAGVGGLDLFWTYRY